MKFKVRTATTFWWPVTVKVPAADRPGAFDEHGFEMLFEALGRKEAKAIDAEAMKARVDGDADAGESLLLKRVCKDWRGLEDENGVALVFTPEAFDELIDYSWTRRGIYLAFAEAMSGEAARKN